MCWPTAGWPCQQPGWRCLTQSVFLSELEDSKGLDAELDRAIAAAKSTIDSSSNLEQEARSVVERLALAWSGALLAKRGDSDVFAAFATSRLSKSHGTLFGTLPLAADVAGLAERAVPVLS